MKIIIKAINIKNKKGLLELIDNFNMEGDMYSLTLDHIWEKEEEKGIEKGIEKTAIEMLKLGSDINFVHKVTKLSLDKLKKLQNREKK